MPLDTQWWKNACGRFQKEIGHTFSSFRLLEEALTHSSYAHEKGLPFWNERLEFLGDAVLELEISLLLYREHPEWDEGQLTTRRARMVCAASLAERASALGLPRLLRLGRGLERQKGRENPSLCADVFEAFLGALYLDGGQETARRVLGEIFADFSSALQVSSEPDPKSALQMYLQTQGNILPDYTIVRREGPPHCPSFFVEVSLEGELLGEARGGSIKEAENLGARKALETLRLREEDTV